MKYPSDWKTTSNILRMFLCVERNTELWYSLKQGHIKLTVSQEYLGLQFSILKSGLKGNIKVYAQKMGIVACMLLLMHNAHVKYRPPA